MLWSLWQPLLSRENYYFRRVGKISIGKACPKDLILRPGKMKLVRHQCSYYFQHVGGFKKKWKLFWQAHDVLMEFSLEGNNLQRHTNLEAKIKENLDLWEDCSSPLLNKWVLPWKDGLSLDGCVLWFMAWPSPSWIIGWYNRHPSRTHYYYSEVSDLKLKFSYGCELQRR